MKTFIIIRIFKISFSDIIALIIGPKYDTLGRDLDKEAILVSAET